MLEDANQAEIPSEVPAAAPESQPVQGGETPVAAPSQDNGSAPQGQGAPQQPTTIPKHRFDEVNYRMQQAERELALLRQGQPQQPTQAHPAEQAPKEEDFPTWEAFVRAEANFTARQEARQAYQNERQQEQQARQNQSEQARAQSAEANWSQKTSEAAQKYPDFFDKIAAAPRLHPILQAVIKPSPAAGDLAYHLAGQPELIAKLHGMHPLDAIAEIGRIEGKLQGSSGQPPQRKPSAGIPAITPVGAGNKQANVDPYALDTSVEDYVRATRTPPRKR